MKKCSYCNTENFDNAQFCIKCGKPFNQTSDKKAAAISIGIIIGVILLIVGIIGIISWLTDVYNSSGWWGIICVIVAVIVFAIWNNK